MTKIVMHQIQKEVNTSMCRNLGEYIGYLKEQKGRRATYQKLGEVSEMDASYIQRVVKGKKKNLNFVAAVKIIEYLDGDIQLAAELAVEEPCSTKTTSFTKNNNCESFKRFLKERNLSFHHAKKIIDLYSKWNDEISL